MKIKIKLIVAVLVLIATGVITIIFFTNFRKSGSNQTENEIQQIKPLEWETKPEYYVTINSVPILSTLGFTFGITIKNISVEPYITNFGFGTCNFSDGGNNYSGSLNNEFVLDKAVLPNESGDFIANDVNVSINGFERTGDGFRKCRYDDKGNRQCNLISKLKIIDCAGYVTTDGKQASYGWGNFPINIEFP